MSGKDKPEGPRDDLHHQGGSTSDEQPTKVTPFTRSALRMVYPKKMPPTPPRHGSLGQRLSRLWRRLSSRF